MKKLALKELQVKSFVTGSDSFNVETIKGGTCPYVCLTDPLFTQDPHGCVSAPQFICDDPHGVTRAHATC